VGEKQVDKMRSFLEEYSQQLREIEEALHESLSDVRQCRRFGSISISLVRGTRELTQAFIWR